MTGIDCKNLLRLFLFYLVTGSVLYIRQYATHPMFDDFVYFLWFDNADLHTLPYLLSPHNDYIWIRPLALLACYVEYLLFGGFMPGYRIAGIFWHASSAVLVNGIARNRLNMRPETALWAGLLFLVHPSAVQAICYPSVRSETMFVFFVLAGLNLFMRSCSDPGRRTDVLLGVICLVLGLLSKETAFVLIPSVIVWLFLAKIPGDKRSRRLSISVILAVFGALYWIIRQSVYHGVGGYELGIDSGRSFLLQLVSATRLILADLPVTHFFTLSPDDIPSKSVYLLAGFVLMLAVLLHAWRSSATSGSFFAPLTLLLASTSVLTLVFLQYNPILLSPRYFYLGSSAVGLLLAPVFSPFRRRNLWILVPVVGVWVFGQIGMQRDFYRAGEVTRYVLTTLDHYCFYLKSGGHIEVYNVPDRIGSVGLNIGHEKYNIFNLECHRRCGLAPAFDLTKGQGLSNWDGYIDSFPGRISAYDRPKPLKPAAGSLVMIMQPADAWSMRQDVSSTYDFASVRQ